MASLTGPSVRLNTAISAGDAEAADIHYHTLCYTKFKNEASAAKSSSSAKEGSCKYT